MSCPTLARTVSVLVLEVLCAQRSSVLGQRKDWSPYPMVKFVPYVLQSESRPQERGFKAPLHSGSLKPQLPVPLQHQPSKQHLKMPLKRSLNLPKISRLVNGIAELESELGSINSFIHESSHLKTVFSNHLLCMRQCFRPLGYRGFGCE